MGRPAAGYLGPRWVDYLRRPWSVFLFFLKESNAEKQFEEKSFKRWPFFFSHSPTWRGGGRNRNEQSARRSTAQVRETDSVSHLSVQFLLRPRSQTQKKKLIGLTDWRQWTHFHPPKTEKLRRWIGFNTLRENATHLNIQIRHWRK